MLAGEPGNEVTDLHALGVTLFRVFTGTFPYGNADATGPPSRLIQARYLNRSSSRSISRTSRRLVALEIS